jgi:hypothetical protein
LNSEHYGVHSEEEFQKNLSGEFTTMEMSLFGLEVMDFKYGIGSEGQHSLDRKMSHVAFRDMLVAAFHSGMRRSEAHQK